MGIGTVSGMPSARLLGHELVGAFGQRRHDADAAIRVAMLQLAEEIPDSLTDARISAGTRSRCPVTATTSGTAPPRADGIGWSWLIASGSGSARRIAALPVLIHAGFASVADALLCRPLFSTLTIRTAPDSAVFDRCVPPHAWRSSPRSR